MVEHSPPPPTISGGLLLAAALFVWFGTTEGAAVDAEDSEKNEDDALADIKYVCPKCGAIIRATKQVNVICGDCNVPFEQA